MLLALFEQECMKYEAKSMMHELCMDATVDIAERNDSEP
jgi:hypothetical protein